MFDHWTGINKIQINNLRASEELNGEADSEEKSSRRFSPDVIVDVRPRALFFCFTSPSTQPRVNCSEKFLPSFVQCWFKGTLSSSIDPSIIAQKKLLASQRMLPLKLELKEMKFNNFSIFSLPCKSFLAYLHSLIAEALFFFFCFASATDVGGNVSPTSCSWRIMKLPSTWHILELCLCLPSTTIKTSTY